MIWSLTWFTPPHWPMPQTPLLELCNILVLFPTLLSPLKLNTAEFLLKTIRITNYFLLYSKISNFPPLQLKVKGKVPMAIDRAPVTPDYLVCIPWHMSHTPHPWPLLQWPPVPWKLPWSHPQPLLVFVGCYLFNVAFLLCPQHFLQPITLQIT